MPIFGVTASSNMSTKLTDFYQIATTTLGSAQSNIEFTSIPATYTHLQLRCLLQTNRGTYGRDGVLMQFNADTGSNYSYHLLGGDGSTAYGGNGTSTSNMPLPEIMTSTAGANVFGVMIIDVLDYANTNKFKTTRTIGGGDHNGTIATLGGTVSLNSGNWRSTNAITSIKLTPSVGTNFSANSSIQLYWVKA